MQTTPLIEAAFAQHSAGNLAEAEALYRSVLAVEPDDLNALQLLGVLASSTGRADEAVGLLARAETVLRARGDAAPRHAALYNNLGNAQRAVGRGGDALWSYRRGLELDPDSAELHANLGNELLAQGRVADALDAYEAAVRLAPAVADNWCNLASALARVGRLIEAAGACGHALEVAPGHFTALSHLGHILVALAQWNDAVEIFQAAAIADPTSWATGLTLGRVLTLAGRPDQAAALLDGLAEQRPDDADILLELIHAQFANGRLDAALAACGRVLAGRPEDVEAQVFAGRIHQAQGRPDQAETAYRTALRCRPDDVAALFHLAQLLQDQGRAAEAAAACRRLLEVQPGHAAALCLLGAAQRSLGDIPAAIDSFRRCLQVNPGLASAHSGLGRIFAAQGWDAVAAECFERVVAACPDDADAHVDLANALRGIDPERAQAAFLRAHRLRPLTTWPAAGGHPDFSVLLINAPGIANIPAQYLVGKSNYDAHFVSLLAGIDYDIALLRRHGDIVVNLVSDADQGRDLLPLARDLAQRLGRPVINPPERIMRTDRASIAARLAGIPGCRVPATFHVAAGDPTRLAGIALPTLLRVAGRHGGDDFERLTTPGEMAAFVARTRATDYYAIEYIDYRSADGYYRKYRLIFTDGRVFPYHLAIGDQWKVHHYTTAMDRHPWMQQEEEAFLQDPATVFSPANFAALAAIQAAIGLDYFGIDCARDQDGALVVFEVNASMLVHDDNADFPYKAPAVAAIKQAFDAMLAKAAAAARPA